MAGQPTRRHFLQAGASAGLLGLSGCGSTSEQATQQTRTRTDIPEENETLTGPSDGADHSPDSTAELTETVDSLAQQLRSLVLPSTYIVDKQDGEVYALNGTTLEREYTGEAGTDDGAVLSDVFTQGLDQSGGRLFIRNNTYEIDRRLELRTSRTEVVSDFARLVWQDHAEREGSDVQTDFRIRGGLSGSKTRNVRVAGLILDPSKSQRTTMTRTVGLAPPTENITIEHCVIFGGKGDQPGGGYGIGEADPADNITIQNCVIRDSDRHAYHPSGEHKTITNCTFLNNAKKGGDIFDLPSSRAIVTDNYFEGNGHGVKVIRDPTGPEAGPPIEGNIIISGNIFVNNYIPNEGSAANLELARPNVESLSVSGNEFRQPTDPDSNAQVAHIKATIGDPGIDGPVHAGRLRITDNTFGGGKDRAIQFQSADDQSMVEKLIIDSNSFDSVGAEILSIDHVLKLVARNNVIDQSSANAGTVDIGDDVGAVVISDNVLYNVVVPDGLQSRSNSVVERNSRFEGHSLSNG